MKVVILTYYWPPSGGSGVQRWLKFVKYLHEFGIEAIVYTVANPKYSITDTSLVNEIPNAVKVLKQPIWEPNNLLHRFGKQKTKESAGFLNPNPSVLGKLLQYIRANYFIPDARKFWVKPSVAFLKKYLRQNPVDAIITSGPPHSLHLIGLALKKELGVHWIADFRDPWTEIDYFEQLPLTKRARKVHGALEKEVLEKSDAVLVVGKTMKMKFEQFSSSIHVLTNGFDTKELSKEILLDTKFTITHVGLMNADRNPHVLWSALKEIADENPSFAVDYEVQLVGKIATQVKESINDLQLQNVREIGYLPHEEVKVYQSRSQVLLLAVNNVPSAKGILTGKIFEYLQAKRPIVAIGPSDGDLAEIITETNAGVLVDFDDVAAIKTQLLKMYAAFKGEGLYVNSKNIEQYHRKNITKKLSQIIQNTIS